MNDLLNKPLHLIAAVLLIIAAILYYYSSEQEKHYQQHAMPYIENTLQIISSWEKETFLHHLSNEAKNSLSEQQLEQLLSHYQKLGTLTSLEPLQFSRLMSILSLTSVKRISYSGTAHFQKGDAQLTITLQENTNGFKIYNFNLSSPLLN